jgi:hypothetical protein
MLPTPERLAEFILLGGLCVKCWVNPMPDKAHWGIYCGDCWRTTIGDKVNNIEWSQLTDAWYKALGKRNI